MKAAPYSVPPGHVLVLRCCGPDGTSHGGFQWPKSGPVHAVDWLPKPVCGGGLHGWLWGAGDVVASGDVHAMPDAIWLVLSVGKKSIVDLGGKVKFPRAEVIFYGARADAVALVSAHAPAGTVAIYGTATAGDGGTATAGYRGTATAGHGGTATAGLGGTATAGDRGTATAGDSGTSTAGLGGTATAGDRGTATAGHGGTATAGHGGTATAGHGGTATAGDGGCISIRWWDRDSSRYRIRSGDVGAKERLKPGVKYRLNAAHEFEEAK